MSVPNLGLLYNKEYFKYFDFDIEGNAKMVENEAMEKIFKINKLDNYKKGDISLHKQAFQLTTVYPGLLCGAGYNHQVGKDKKKKNEQDNTFPEFQLGYYFDHTTGLPVIPGSSIKGVLRYACQMRDGEYLLDILERLKDKSVVFNTKQFVEKVFGSENNTKGTSIYKKDIFLDAVPVSIENNSHLFGNDYITNHIKPTDSEDPESSLSALKEPNPVQFLRVQPGVTYEFRFILRDDEFISAKLKQAIFKEMILDLGVGAKTNVGYGQFEEK